MIVTILLKNISIRDSWEIKKSMSNVMTITLSQQYEEINKLIPNGLDLLVQGREVIF